jgi:hypothetical protein
VPCRGKKSVTVLLSVMSCAVVVCIVINLK